MNLDETSLEWRKSGRSDTVGNQCVEVAGIREKLVAERAIAEAATGERYFHDAEEIAGFHADFRQITKGSLDETAS